MLLAQLSDLHVSLPGSQADVDHQAAARLERAVAHVCGLDPRPDAVVLTGDLVNDGEPGEYARLLALLAPLPMPVYALPGNHDDREQLRAAFLARGYLPELGPLCYAVDVGPLRLLALDTHVPGQPSGRLGAQQLAWLQARLAEAPGRPTLLLMHHPPFRTGIRGMDEGMGLADAEALAEVVRHHPQVERVLCGHLHRPIVKRFAGTVALTCPSTMHQLQLDLREQGRLALVPEPPALQLHLWREELGLVSHLAYVS
ncbi:MAG TPA: phosphodiesterase [Aggregicoccus sp.]|nr:phosphodiesterase [Aggregicoccus sp.]